MKKIYIGEDLIFDGSVSGRVYKGDVNISVDLESYLKSPYRSDLISYNFSGSFNLESEISEVNTEYVYRFIFTDSGASGIVVSIDAVIWKDESGGENMFHIDYTPVETFYYNNNFSDTYTCSISIGCDVKNGGYLIYLDMKKISDGVRTHRFTVDFENYNSNILKTIYSFDSGDTCSDFKVGDVIKYIGHNTINGSYRDFGKIAYLVEGNKFMVMSRYGDMYMFNMNDNTFEKIKVNSYDCIPDTVPLRDEHGIISIAHVQKYAEGFEFISEGWYRVYIYDENGQNRGQVIRLEMNTDFNYKKSCSYTFEINLSFDNVSINQFASVNSDSNLISKIRVSRGNHSHVYVDIYYSANELNVLYFNFSGLGDIQLIQNPEMIENDIVTEFETCSGFKSQVNEKFITFDEICSSLGK